MAKQYWLMKTEPEAFSWEDLKKEPKATAMWDGVRNFRARNFMRKEMAVGDGVLFYHSNAKPPGVVGVAKVASETYPDPTQFDPDSKYYDPKSRKEKPKWWLVDIKAVKKLKRFVPLAELKEAEELEGMWVTKRGMRLSIQPVTEHEWLVVMRLGGLDKSPV